MKLTCVIIDDEYLAINILKEYVGRLEGLAVMATFTQAEKALLFLASATPDILFLDIQMPLINGFQFLTRLNEQPLVIFTTAHQEYAARAFDLDVLDYLVKPVSFERFSIAMARAMEYLQYKAALILPDAEKRNYIMIRSDHRIVKINLDDIGYIEGLSEYVRIHTPNRIYITLAALKRLEEELPPPLFIRIHKSYIVNASFVVSYTKEEVILRSQQSLPVGRAYKDNLTAL